LDLIDERLPVGYLLLCVFFSGLFGFRHSDFSPLDIESQFTGV
jgi:hypothetical protein